MIFQLEAEGEIEGKDLIKEIIASQHTLFGDIGSAKKQAPSDLLRWPPGHIALSS